jgi:hypothetical protein
VQFIENWKSGGKIYFDYLKLIKEFDYLIKNVSFSVEFEIKINLFS